jgi:hypothetical protein
MPSLWEPNEPAPALVEALQVHAEVTSTGTSTGGSTGYYKLPEGATDLQDLIEAKRMSFSRGNIFKAAYRLGEKDVASEAYDLRKIIWFAERMLKALDKPA